MAFRLKRIVRCGRGLYSNLSGFDFKRLFGLGRKHYNPFYCQCCSHISFGNLIEVVKEFLLVDHLNGSEKASVVDLDKAEFIRAPVVSDPALYQYFFVSICCCVSK